MGTKVEFDKATREWFESRPDVQTTVMRCDGCGLYFKPSLGHKCEVKKGKKYVRKNS